MRSTGSHRFYRESDQSWVSAGALVPGDQLQGTDGSLTLGGIAKVPGLHSVFNMTVEGEHVYRVSTFGMLVHNNCGDELVTQISGAKGTVYYNAPATSAASQINPRLTQRLEAFRAYKANGGTMDMARWVKHTKANPNWGDWSEQWLRQVDSLCGKRSRQLKTEFTDGLSVPA
ncbi:hypothetical protein ACYFX5_01295 [Bremerella sp. T1]